MAQYGDPVHSSDEYGMYSSGTGTGAFSGPYETPGTTEQHYGLSGALQRSTSSSSSSSSEEDGVGGRRRKNKKIKNKVKKKLPASHSGDKSHFTANTGIIPPATGLKLQGETEHQHHEKKGFLEKIKEKLPGSHHHH